METVEETQGRGQLTERVKEKSKELFGYEMSVRELRLLPFIQYTLTNSQKLDPSSLNKEEQEILAKFVEKGFIIDGVNGMGRAMISEGVKLRITKTFWNNICEILWLGYVDLTD